MIRLYDFDEVRPEEILNRDIRAEADVEATVDAIIADVRARGDAALIDYAAKFDHADLTDVRVSQAEIEEAFAELDKTDPEFITTLKMAAENIRHFHEQQLHKNFVDNGIRKTAVYMYDSRENLIARYLAIRSNNHFTGHSQTVHTCI